MSKRSFLRYAIERARIIRCLIGPRAFKSTTAHRDACVHLARRNIEIGGVSLSLRLLRRAEGIRPSDRIVRRELSEALMVAGQKTEALQYKIKNLKSEVKRSARERNVYSLLKGLVEIESLEATVPSVAAQYLNDLMDQEGGRKSLCLTSSKLLETYSHSPLIVYLRAVTLAKQGHIDAAYETINRALRSFRAELINMLSGENRDIWSSDIRRHVQLNSIWNAVNHIGRQGMSWAVVDSDYDILSDNIYDSTEYPENGNISATLILSAATGLRESRRQEEYLSACKRSFESASTLSFQIKAIKGMIREGIRRMPAYHEAYELASESYLRIRPVWDVELNECLATDLDLGEPASSLDISVLIPLLRLARKLGFSNDESRIARRLIDVAEQSQTDQLRWQVAAALAGVPSDENLEAASRLISGATSDPKTGREVRAFFTWASASGEYSLAHAMFDRLPDAQRRGTAILPYVNICENDGQFSRAEDIASQISISMAMKPHRMSPALHWRICGQRKGELRFLQETVDWYQMVPQPRIVKGVVFVPVMRASGLRGLPLVVLMELKRRGWAVVPLVEGTLPMEGTGDPEIDRFAWCIGRTGQLKIRSGNPFAPVDGFEGNIAEGVLRWRDVDLSHAMWESASINRRRYSIDFTCPSLIAFLKRMAGWAETYISVLENIRLAMRNKGIKVGFISDNIHILPNAIFRQYCDKYGDPQKFFCVHAVNAYENYFSNFSSNISTRISLRNVTSAPHVRAGFLPEPSEFENWYRKNRDRAHEMLRTVEYVTKMRRSTGADERSAEAESCLRRIVAWREKGGKVACLFGKVVCDLGVPYDGGPAHLNMKEWLNHTIAAVRGSNTLLLIKPHPHELKNDIGLFLTEYFTDLIEGELPDNVVALDHRWFDMHDLNGRIDLGLLYNGTTAVELGIMGIPALLCSHFGPTDYPIGHAAPRDRAQYERMVRFEEPVVVADDLKLRSAAWLTYLNSDEVSVPYRYYARQVTNRVLYPPWWFREDIEAYLRDGDPHVELLAARVAGNPFFSPVKEAQFAAE